MSESNIKNMDAANGIKSTMIGKNKKILEFGAADDSAAKIFKRNKCTIRQFGLDSGNIDSLNTKKLFGNEKFDVIIIDKILESLKNPTKILQQLQNLLENNGFFVCVVHNFLFAPNRINFLNGNLDFQSSSINLNLYTLDTFLLLLDNANLKITQVNRIKQKSNAFSDYTLNYLTYSNNLIDAILQDPESDTISYVLKVEPGQSVPTKVRQYILQTFPKNITSSYLNSKNEFTEKSIAAKDEMIKGLETTINDKDKFLEKVIEDYKLDIKKIKSSKAWKMLNKLDRFRKNT